MRVLVVGGGGREHAIVWKLAQSPKISKLFCTPGNGGIAELAECANIKPTDIDGVCCFAKANSIDLVVIGPDDPLSLGLADNCEALGIRAFGPRKAAAKLEWSKSYAKGLMKKYNIPTAGYSVHGSVQSALDALDALEASGSSATSSPSGTSAAFPSPRGFPVVVKADGLALGKGVTIAEDRDAAESAIRSCMLDKVFGDAGSQIVLEECITGPEMTVLAFTDGKTIKPMPCSQDHKRAYDGDRGPNTGGMGAFAPSPIYTPEVERECREKIFEPTLDMLKKEGIGYRGVLYFGLMLTAGGVKLIEYNSRFGDPETQVTLPLLKNDLIDIFDAVIDGHLDNIELKWENSFSACVVAASGGYPGSYKTGYEIDIPQSVGPAMPNTGMRCENATIFHAGTRRESGRLYTSGGRVLGVTASGSTLGAAVSQAYEAMARVSFEGMFYRKDIGGKYRL